MRWFSSFLLQKRRRSASVAIVAPAATAEDTVSEDGVTVVVPDDSLLDKDTGAAPTTSERLSWPARDTAKQGRATGVSNSPDVLRGAPTQRVDYVQAARLVGGRPQTDVPAHEAKTQLVGTTGIDDDPVVGWLVIVEGPGKGRSLEVGIGANQIGRAPSQKICLNFGDTTISRENHAVLIYEPKSRRFIVQRGDARGLTYVGEEPVVGPVDLFGGESLGVGETRLRFIAFCGPDFGWS